MSESKGDRSALGGSRSLRVAPYFKLDTEEPSSRIVYGGQDITSWVKAVTLHHTEDVPRARPKNPIPVDRVLMTNGRHVAFGDAPVWTSEDCAEEQVVRWHGRQWPGGAVVVSPKVGRVLAKMAGLTAGPSEVQR